MLNYAKMFVFFSEFTKPRLFQARICFHEFLVSNMTLRVLCGFPWEPSLGHIAPGFRQIKTSFRQVKTNLRQIKTILNKFKTKKSSGWNIFFTKFRGTSLNKRLAYCFLIIIIIIIIIKCLEHLCENR